jgi:hypothetical protein
MPWITLSTRDRPAVGVAHLVGDARRLDQRLRGHAAVPQAVAAELVLLDQRHLGAERGAARRDDEAAGAAADHCKVEVRAHEAKASGFRLVVRLLRSLHGNAGRTS